MLVTQGLKSCFSQNTTKKAHLQVPRSFPPQTLKIACDNEVKEEIFFFKKDLFEREREREHMHKQGDGSEAEGEAGSQQGGRCETQSQDPRIKT